MHLAILMWQNHHPSYHHLRVVNVRVHNSSQKYLLSVSGERKASAGFLVFGSESGPLAGVVRLVTCCSLWTFLRGASRLGGRGLATFDLVEARNDPAFVGDLKASFHCLTSSTASLKFAGGFATGASVLLEPIIQACLSSFLAETLRLGSF